MSDKWTTNDNDFSNDVVSIEVNGTVWDVADTYARSQLLLKVPAPLTAGTAGQILSLTADGTSWIDAPSSSGSIEYDAGEGLSLTNTTFSVDWDTVAKKTDIVNYTAGGGISIVDGVISCTVSGGSTYTAGTGIKIENGVISCTVSGGTAYTAGTGISISNGVISCTVSGGSSYTAGTGISIENDVISCTLSVPTDYVTQEDFEETIGDINAILDSINGEVL